jgi:hypothetical protein
MVGPQAPGSSHVAAEERHEGLREKELFPPLPPVEPALLLVPPLLRLPSELLLPPLLVGPIHPGL